MRRSRWGSPSQIAVSCFREPGSRPRILQQFMNDLAEYRAALDAWLDAHHETLAPRYALPGTLDDHVAQMQRVKSILFEGGWMQYGWPERVGGRGGSPMLRMELGAAIA